MLQNLIYTNSMVATSQGGNLPTSEMLIINAQETNKLSKMG